MVTATVEVRSLALNIRLTKAPPPPPPPPFLSELVIKVRPDAPPPPPPHNSTITNTSVAFLVQVPDDEKVVAAPGIDTSV
jgi:hypothetical protein